jgi:hypothetical protein
VLWVILVVLMSISVFGGASPRFQQLMFVCEAKPCPLLTLQREEIRVLEELGLQHHHYALFHVSVDIVAATFNLLLAVLIFWQMRDSWLGLLVAYAIALFGMSFMVEVDSAFFGQYSALKPILDVVTPLLGFPFLVLLLVFPDGSFVPRWTRWVAAAYVFVGLFDLVFENLGAPGPSNEFSLLLIVVFLIGLALGMGSQIYRYGRVSTALERQQTKWVILGFVGFCLAILGWTLFIELFPLPHGRGRVLFNLFFFILVTPVFIFFPAALVLSMLRYRLWDIDLVIRRTLQYAVLTGLLALVYFGSVVVLQSLLGVFGDAQSPAITVVSTLAIAALFTPLRTRIQTFIDQRFFRAKYDAEQALAGFAAVTRDEVELDKLSIALLNVVSETMQPEVISLLVRRPK